MKKHNFYAGPSILSQFTIEETAKAIRDFAGTGLSVMEISHRSKEFIAVVDEAVALVKELLEVPEGYDVLFLQGGASMQFCMVPYNLLKKKAAYLNTGAWAKKAIKEAHLEKLLKSLLRPTRITTTFQKIMRFRPMPIIFILPRTIPFMEPKSVSILR